MNIRNTEEICNLHAIMIATTEQITTRNSTTNFIVNVQLIEPMGFISFYIIDNYLIIIAFV